MLPRTADPQSADPQSAAGLDQEEDANAGATSGVFALLSSVEVSDPEGRRWRADHWGDPNQIEPDSWWNVSLGAAANPDLPDFTHVNPGQWEGLFGQDLNADGLIAPRPAGWVEDAGLEPDGVGLRRSGEGVLILTTAAGEQPVPEVGLISNFPYTQQLTFMAAAAAAEGGHWLMDFDPRFRVWSVLRLGADGGIDWRQGLHGVEPERWEAIFAQDFSGDGVIAPTAAAVTLDDGLQPDGVGLRLSGEGFLQLTGPGPALTLPGLEGWLALPPSQLLAALAEGRRVAVAAAATGGFWLAAFDDATWSVDAITAEGDLDWSGSYAGIADISPWESTFATDLNGDGRIAAPPAGSLGELMAPFLVGSDPSLWLTSKGGGINPTSGGPDAAITGTRRSERLIGTEQDDRIIGGRPGAGRYGIDRIRSGAGSDEIVLGSGDRDFYAVAGNNDYALIRQGSLLKDQLRLAGPLSAYRLEPNARVDGHEGTALYAPGGDLMALLQIRDGAPVQLADIAVGGPL